jgi:hypothetical protein
MGEVLGSLLPHPQLHVRLTERSFELFVLGFELELPRRTPGPATGREAGPAGVEKRLLPVVDGLLRNPVPPPSVGRGQLAAQHRQHHTQLLFRGLRRRPRHRCSSQSDPNTRT